MNTPTPWTTARIRAAKGTQRLACLTATDAAFARLLDEADIPLILVGDSLGMTVLGYPTTLPVTMDAMVHHAGAVVRGVRHALVVADLPFMSYQVSTSQALRNAGRLMQDAGVAAVKLEGGAHREERVRALVENGIPVMGHIGLLPQSVHAMGGYRIQGRSDAGGERLMQDARALDRAGVFALVLEGIPSTLATAITAAVSAPTIGIGAGAGCDGQILVLHDLLGLTPDPTPRFVRRFANVSRNIVDAATAYRESVSTATFPSETESY